MSHPFSRRSFHPREPLHRRNGKIRAREIRVIDENKQQLGVMSLNEGLRLAQAKDLDLVEVVPQATPPVCRIVNYGKLLYEEAKRESHTRPAAGQMKEIQISPVIEAHLHIVAQKLDGVVALGRQVMRFNHGRNLDFLHLPRAWPGVRLALGLLVKQFAVVHNPAHRRGRLRHDFHQVQIFGLRQAQSFIERHHAQLLFVFVQNPDLACANFSIAPMQWLAGMKGTRRKGAAQAHPTVLRFFMWQKAELRICK